MSLRLQCVDDEAIWAALEPEWNALLERSSVRGLFLTWEWLSTWWSVYGEAGRLYVLTLRDEAGLLVAAAPFQRRRRRLFGVWPAEVVEFIGSGGDVTPEHLDLIIADGYHEAAVEAFGRHLAQKPGIDGVELRSIDHDSVHRHGLRRVLDQAGLEVSVREHSVCPVMTLPATEAAFLASRSRNYRKKMGEYVRRTEHALEAHYRISATADELSADMARLVALHRKRWGGRSLAFASSKYVGFHQRVAQRFLARDWVRLFSLEGKDGPLALLYCYVYANRYYFYQAGRDPDYERFRVGLVLMHRAILHAIREGARSFDFLTGDEDYKYRWADAEVRTVRLVCWMTPVARGLSTVRAGLSRLKRRVLLVVQPRRRQEVRPRRAPAETNAACSPGSASGRETSPDAGDD
jgi:CelD/BcsL family acetyltransferase involved in cellulose biosynthesis